MSDNAEAKPIDNHMEQASTDEIMRWTGRRRRNVRDSIFYSNNYQSS